MMGARSDYGPGTGNMVPGKPGCGFESRALRLKRNRARKCIIAKHLHAQAARGRNDGGHHDHPHVPHQGLDLLVGLSLADIGRRRAGPERDLQHETLAVLVGQLVVDAGHRVVGPMRMREPSIKD
jgi:hypothetical protein